jgi:hypothetical protein
VYVKLPNYITIVYSFSQFWDLLQTLRDLNFHFFGEILPKIQICRNKEFMGIVRATILDATTKYASAKKVNLLRDIVYRLDQGCSYISLKLQEIKYWPTGVLCITFHARRSRFRMEARGQISIAKSVISKPHVKMYVLMPRDEHILLSNFMDKFIMNSLPVTRNNRVWILRQVFSADMNNTKYTSRLLCWCWRLKVWNIYVMMLINWYWLLLIPSRWKVFHEIVNGA